MKKFPQRSEVNLRNMMMKSDCNTKECFVNNNKNENDAQIVDRVQRMLAEMTLADYIGQMSQMDINMLLQDDGNGGKELNKDLVERYIGEVGVGSVLNLPTDQHWTARQYREAMIGINQVATKHGRPPVIWGLDSVHGANYVKNAIMSPQPINIAATWNVTMAEQAGKLASRDTRAAGINWLFSPLEGLAVIPLWSRVYETFGEDPVLTGDMAAAMITGIQTPDDKDDAIPSRAAACSKHYIGYSMPRTGHDRSPSWTPTRHLYQYFLLPWKKAMQAGVKTVMESYTETDGVPMVGNRDKLNYLLRQRLNFTGVLVTDYEEIRNLHNWHSITGSTSDAIIYSLREGTVDMSMIPWEIDEYTTSIVSGIQSQQLSMDRIRISAERVLQLKHDLNMFDETVTIVDSNIDLVGTDEATVLPMVQDSIILAQNEGNLLPIDPNTHLKILITGPTANSLRTQSGGWTHQWQGSPSDDWFTYGSTIWDSFQNETTSQWDVKYSCGVDILGKDCDDPDESSFDESVIDQVKHWAGLTPTTSMARAVEAAKDSDITVICIGEEPNTEKPGDVRTMLLPAGQNDLIHAIQRNTDTKIVLVFFGGRPKLLSGLAEIADAVILGFLPGPSGGQAVLDIITGRVNPSGRLPTTYPIAEDGGGSPYWHAVSDKCTHGDEGTTLPHWEYVNCPVQWPFGHGLSYTTFEYSNFSAIGGIDDDLHASVTVKNTGDTGGAETVMFFTFDEFRQTTPEYKRLRAFEKIYLNPGESKEVKITVPIDDLRFVGPHDDRHYILDPKMTSYLGVGYNTDCRLRDDQHNPDENNLCVRLVSQAPDKPYVAACEAACSLWTDGGHDCAKFFGLDTKQCLHTCMKVGDDGWGWNYVNCLESVVYGMRDNGASSTTGEQCMMMKSLCRDIFQTGSLTASGVGVFEEMPGINSCLGTNERDTYGYWLALLSAMLTTLMMMKLIDGAFKRKREKTEEDRFKEIQFTSIRDNVME